MTWFLFAFLCAVFLSAATIIEKRVLAKVHSIDFALSSAILNFVLSIPFLFFISKSSVQADTLLVIFISSFMAAFSFLFVAKGMRHMEVSLVSPLLSLSPGTTSILAFLLLGERLGNIQITGVFFMIIGSYILTMQPSKGLFEPLRLFTRSHYMKFIALSLLFYSLGAIFDRVALSELNATLPLYMFSFHMSVAILYIPIAFFFGGSVKGIREAFKKSGPDIFFSSLFTVTYRYFQMEALKLAAVGLVSTVKRTSSLFTTIIGGEIFHEKNIKRKAFASVVIIAGSILIIL
jgi:bacterial/archaeal transporter family protein